MRAPLHVIAATAALAASLSLAPTAAAADDADVHVAVPTTSGSVTVTVTVTPTGPGAASVPVPGAPVNAPAPEPAPETPTIVPAPETSQAAPQAVPQTREAVPVPAPETPATAPAPTDPQSPRTPEAGPEPPQAAPVPAPPETAAPTQETVPTPAPQAALEEGPEYPPEEPPENAPPSPADDDAQGRPLPADQVEASWTDSAGTTSTYHLLASQVEGPLRGVVAYFDGDGQNGVKNPRSSYVLGGAKGITAQAGKRGYATLAIRTPDGQTDTWYQDGDRNAAYAAQLLQRVRDELGVADRPIWLVGFSGGSQLITKYLLPEHAGQFTSGGAVITGGGGEPRTTPTTLSPGFRLHWETGTEDTEGYDALRDARAGSTEYAERGAWVSIATPAGVDHGGIPPRLGDIVGSQLDAAPTTGQPPAQPTSPSPAPELTNPATGPPSTRPTPAPDDNAPTHNAPAPDDNAPTDNAPSRLPFKLGVFAHDGPEMTRVAGFEQVIGRQVDMLSTGLRQSRLTGAVSCGFVGFDAACWNERVRSARFDGGSYACRRTEDRTRRCHLPAVMSCPRNRSG